MYARIIKITFPNEFAKKSADMFLNAFVLEAAKDMGLLYRIALTPKPEQRVAIQIYEDKSNSKATRQKFGDEKLKEMEQSRSSSGCSGQNDAWSCSERAKPCDRTAVQSASPGSRLPFLLLRARLPEANSLGLFGPRPVQPPKFRRNLLPKASPN